MLKVTFHEATLWLNSYYKYWRTGDVPACSNLFTPDAVYVVSPYAEPWPDGERMTGRDQIAEFLQWITADHLRFLNGGYDLWAVKGNEAYARWWADLEFRGRGYWVQGEGVLKLSFNGRVDGHLLCTELHEWNPTEPEPARHYEPYPEDGS